MINNNVNNTSSSSSSTLLLLGAAEAAPIVHPPHQQTLEWEHKTTTTITKHAGKEPETQKQDFIFFLVLRREQACKAPPQHTTKELRTVPWTPGPLPSDAGPVFLRRCQWCYSGPFSMFQIQDWIQQGHFQPSIHLRQGSVGIFQDLSVMGLMNYKEDPTQNRVSWKACHT